MGSNQEAMSLAYIKGSINVNSIPLPTTVLSIVEKQDSKKLKLC